MSLLLDALRKAEKAKEAAKGGAKPRASSEGALSLEPTADEAQRVMTRDKLPDISAPLEIGSEDLAPRQSAVPPLESAASLAASAPPPNSAPVSGSGAGKPARPARGRRERAPGEVQGTQPEAALLHHARRARRIRDRHGRVFLPSAAPETTTGLRQSDASERRAGSNRSVGARRASPARSDVAPAVGTGDSRTSGCGSERAANDHRGEPESGAVCAECFASERSARGARHSRCSAGAQAPSSSLCARRGARRFPACAAGLGWYLARLAAGALDGARDNGASDRAT